MIQELFEDLYRHAKTPQQVYAITAIVIVLSLIAALGIIALLLVALTLLS